MDRVGIFSLIAIVLLIAGLIGIHAQEHPCSAPAPLENRVLNPGQSEDIIPGIIITMANGTRWIQINE